MKTFSNPQPATLSKPKQLTEKQQFKLTSTKLLSYRTTSSSIEQLLQTNIGPNYAKQKQSYSQVQQVRIMHSDCLQYLKGINVFSASLIVANLNSNAIVSLQGIEILTKLQVLQIRNNKLTTLKGVQRLSNLTKIDASNNLLNTFEGLNQIKATSRLQKIYLSGNYLQDLQDLQWVQKCKKLRQIVFFKGKSSNPICQIYGDYIFVLNQYIGNKEVIVDDSALEEHLKLLQSSNSALQQQSQNHPIDSVKQHFTNPKPKPFFQQTQPLHTRPISLSPFNKPTPSNQLYLTQQQLYSQQAQQLLNFKSEHIQQLKQRLGLIQLQKSQQYKELLKKEAQVQRLSAQSSQLFSQMQQKEKSLSELHKRLQDMLKSSSQKSKLLEVKSTQIQRLKQQLSQQKLLNAQNKALVKDYQRRLSQLHQKTLSTIQQRTLKQDQLKRKSQQMYEQNYLLMKQKQEMTSRLRQLTELLRQWEFKYEAKVNELQATHSHEREEIIRQSQQKLSATKQYYEHQLVVLQQSLREQVLQVQSTYKSSFQETIEKHKRLKAAYDESTRNQRELQVMLKTALDKNQEQEEMMGKLQEMVLRTTHELKSNEEDKQRILKELNQVKYRFAHEVSAIEQRLNKALYQKQRTQKQLSDLKQTYNTLIGDNEQLLKQQKTSQQLQQRCQDLQSALDIKTQLLQDKNETIEQLKQQLEQAQREAQEKADPKELQSLRKKYQKYKKECQQLSQESNALLQENEELRKENDDIKEIATQFQNMRQTLTTYQQSIQQKDEQLQQLVKFVEECKRVTEIEKQQIEQYKRQAKRSEVEADNRERQLREQLRQVEISHQRELDQMKIENQKYRKNALEQLQSVFMKLQK